MDQTKDTFLNFLKTLEVVPQKDKKSYIMVYAPRALRMELVEITPKPSIGEMEEAISWLTQHKLAIPVLGRNSNVEMEFLVRLN